MALDLQRELPESWYDIYDISRKKGQPA